MRSYNTYKGHLEHDQPCSDGEPSQVYVEHARRFATLLDATLALGSPDVSTKRGSASRRP